MYRLMDKNIVEMNMEDLEAFEMYDGISCVTIEIQY